METWNSGVLNSNGSVRLFKKEGKFYLMIESWDDGTLHGVEVSEESAKAYINEFGSYGKDTIEIKQQ